MAHTIQSRGHLPEVLGLPAKSNALVGKLPDYHTGTIRSQSFSLSQRFNPNTSLWLYFAPLPLIGFRPPKLFPLEPAGTSLNALCSLALGTHSSWQATLNTPSMHPSCEWQATRTSSVHSFPGLQSFTPAQRPTLRLPNKRQTKPLLS
jgi:hypothetical protein